ncbi:MAG TPA: hypothetical protein VFV87_00370 [Pirellulaceae bacterium]|nr:hypothetical protein [Pirellulaceae bacterium]
MSNSLRVLLTASVLIAGCEAAVPAAAPQKANPAPTATKETPTTAVAPPAAASKDFVPAQPIQVGPARAPLEDLARQAEAQQFDLPALDEGKIAAAGIRRLDGQHITIYTDLPEAAGQAVQELPQVFDAAVPLWCAYFGVDPATVEKWKIVGCVMVEKGRFQGAGLYSDNLPDFPNGYSAGSQVWLYDQPSDYYRRHLLLHEGTHAFMTRWLGGAGPPWYMEGMAELLGTHEWAGGKLTLGYLPRTKEEVPYWGRVKIVKDEFAANRGMTLDLIMNYDSRAHLRNEPYGWCWAAATFFDQHPLTQAAFRDLRSQVKDRTVDFNNRFRGRLKDHLWEIDEDWLLFVLQCEYGYDVARAAVVRKPVGDLPAAGASVSIAADRGWQSSGFKLMAGRTYRLTAEGRYQVGNSPKPWPCEPGGVTIRYVAGQPLGMLLAATSDEEMPARPITPLANPQPIGVSATLTPETTGTLYLRINEAPSGLADNAGTLSVRIEPQP